MTAPNKQCILFNYKAIKSRTFGLSLAAELFCVAFFQLATHTAPEDFAPVLQGLTLAALVFIAGHASGGHLNPLISLSTAALGYHPWLHAMMYCTMQCLGGILGALFAQALFPNSDRFFLAGVTGPGCLDRSTVPADVTNSMIIGWECLMTGMLMSSFLMCGLDTPAACGSFAPVVAGLATAACAGSGGQYTGASLNPARIVGPIVIFGCKEELAPQYLLGQLLGAIFSTGLVAAIARPGPLNPCVSRPALKLKDWEAWRLWLTGYPPSRLKITSTETVETIQDYYLQIICYLEGTPLPVVRRRTSLDLEILFGEGISTMVRTTSQKSEPNMVTEAPREVALMLQHPEITQREHLMETCASPMKIFRS
ncbi:unnamed protein product [Symbiodinium sp. CCMP2456]|nr:unnamed protein product [Symbiodinium sp. CCMP2456]